MLIKPWLDTGITKIHHLIGSQGEIMNYTEFKIAYPNLKTNFLQYEGIISSIKKYQKKCKVQVNTEFKVSNTKAIQTIKDGNKAVKFQLYDSGKLPTAVNKWNKNYLELSWDSIFMKCLKTTNDIKLRWFQARLIHRILPTNKFLFRCKYKDSPLCSFCNTEEESIVHLFWECPVVSLLWKKFEKLLNDNCSVCVHLKLSEQLIIFGTKKNVVTDKALDLMLVLGKFFIYKCKFKNSCPTIEGFIAFLKLRYYDELYTSKTYSCYDNFLKKWLPYNNLFPNI